MAGRKVAFLICMLGSLNSALGQDFIVDDVLKSDREAVRAAQTELSTLGFDTGTPDGLFGGKTQAAIQGFVNRFGIDGEAGLTENALAQIHTVFVGRFGDPFALDKLVAPKGVETTWLLAKTDVRAINENCANCNVNQWIQAVGDLDGDGLDEIVVTGHAADANFSLIDKATRMEIFSPGNSTEGAHFPGIDPASLPARAHEREAVIADFNGDGLGDLFIAAQGFDAPPFPGEQNVLLLSSADGHVDVSTTHLPQINDMAHGLAEGDIDGDGDIDLLVITNQGQNNILPYVLTNDGTGHFSQTGIQTIMDPALVDFRPRNRDHRAEYSNARLFDLNADGALDLLLLARGESPERATRFSGTRRSLLIYNDGNGYFPTENLVELPTDRWGHATFTNDVDAVDLNGDGRLDLILTQSTRKPSNGPWYGQYLQVLMNEDGRWVDRTAQRLWSQGYPGMDDLNFADNTRFADIDHDGDLDLVTQNLSPTWRNSPDDGAIMIGLNDGNGNFEPVKPDWLSFGQGYQNRNLVVGRFGAEGAIGLASFRLNGQYNSGPDRTWGILLDIHEVKPFAF